MLLGQVVHTLASCYLMVGGLQRFGSWRLVLMVLMAGSLSRRPGRRTPLCRHLHLVITLELSRCVARC